MQTVKEVIHSSNSKELLEIYDKIQEIFRREATLDSEGPDPDHPIKAVMCIMTSQIAAHSYFQGLSKEATEDLWQIVHKLNISESNDPTQNSLFYFLWRFSQSLIEHVRNEVNTEV